MRYFSASFVSSLQPLGSGITSPEEESHSCRNLGLPLLQLPNIRNKRFRLYTLQSKMPRTEASLFDRSGSVLGKRSIIFRVSSLGGTALLASDTSIQTVCRSLLFNSHAKAFPSTTFASRGFCFYLLPVCRASLFSCLLQRYCIERYPM